MNPIAKKLLWLTLFSIAMGYLETSVVVYLRALYYPDGFMFPLKPIAKSIIVTELWRELATLIMLVGIGILTGRNKTERFGFFLYCFAIWDIFYYAFLKALLDWPESLFTWDILFLIPVPWVGPVIAPCVTAITMIALALVITRHNEEGFDVKLNRKEWSLLISGTIVTIISFMWDYLLYNKTSFAADAINGMEGYMPQQFNWWLFGAGELLVALPIILLNARYKAHAVQLAQASQS